MSTLTDKRQQHTGAEKSSARYVIFCTAPPEKVEAAAKAAFPGAKKSEILFVGPERYIFSTMPDVLFLSWGEGFFSFSAGKRIWEKLNGLNPSGVALPLNNDEGYGYGALRIYSWILAPGKVIEVAPDGEVQPLSKGLWKLAALKAEEIFHQSAIGTLHLLTPFFVKALAPPHVGISLPADGGPLEYETIKEIPEKGRPKVSMVIRSYNEAELIERNLKAVMGQKGVEKEIVIIDSGSTDATVEIASEFPVRIYRIRKKDFSYGRSLNLGTRLARGEIVVCLSAHAIPTNDEWLLKLIEPLKDPFIGGVHGGELPIDERCGLFERKILMDAYAKQPGIRTDSPVFSNANAAIPRELLMQVPFDEKLEWAEDQVWAREVQKIGYKTAYVADAAVHHSHGLTMRQNFERSIRFHRMLFTTVYKDRAQVHRGNYRDHLVGRSVSFARFLSTNGYLNHLAAVLYAPYCEFVNYLGCELAWREYLKRKINGTQ